MAMQLIYDYEAVTRLIQRLEKAEFDACGLDDKANKLLRKVRIARANMPRGVSLAIDFDELDEVIKL